MAVTVLYPEARQQPDDLERGIFGTDVRIVKRDTGALSELPDADCAEADGLMIMGFGVSGADLARFPRLRAIIRMGVGYDKLDRPAAAARNVLICNVPDYGTTEVADHAIALALTLRRGILLHHELQRKDPPAPWRSLQNPMIQRLGTQTFGIVGLGRIAAAGLDVLPQEPPVEPIPKLLAAYRAKEPWLEGRLVVTPHSAWLTPHSWEDTRRKSAETMRAALLTNKPQNVITPEMY